MIQDWTPTPCRYTHILPYHCGQAGSGVSGLNIPELRALGLVLQLAHPHAGSQRVWVMAEKEFPETDSSGGRCWEWSPEWVAITPAGALCKATSPPRSILPVCPGPFHSELFFPSFWEAFPAGTWSNYFFHSSLPLHIQTWGWWPVPTPHFSYLWCWKGCTCAVSPPLRVQQVFTAPPCRSRAHAHTDLLSSRGDWC